MGYIHCCGALHKTRTFRLVPQKGFLICEVDQLKRCPICDNLVVQLTRVDDDDKIVSTIRHTNTKAVKFFEKLEPQILYEDKIINYAKHSGKFYLNYNEFGVKKRCYSNLSRLKMGRIENMAF